MSEESEKQIKGYESYLRKKGVPRHLSKFRRWHCGHKSCTLTNECRTCKWDRLIITDQKIWFAAPATFNDPFDCKLPKRFDLMSKHDQLSFVEGLANEFDAGLTEEEQHLEAKRLVRTSGVFSDDPVIRGAAMKEYWQLISKSYGVLSLAGELESILLWSHYADSHRGYCIEVDAHSLYKELLDQHRADDQFVDVYRVAYQEELPMISPSNDIDESFDRHMKLLTTKSSVWEYEKEYRFVCSVREDRERAISKGAIKRVILGCQMSVQHRQEICNLISMQLPNTEIWQAVRSMDKFSLDFRSLSD